LFIGVKCIQSESQLSVCLGQAFSRFLGRAMANLNNDRGFDFAIAGLKMFRRSFLIDFSNLGYESEGADPIEGHQSRSPDRLKSEYDTASSFATLFMGSSMAIPIGVADIAVWMVATATSTATVLSIPGKSCGGNGFPFLHLAPGIRWASNLVNEG
jgi:hypothetical protein